MEWRFEGGALAVVEVWRSDLRRRWSAWLLLGLMGGVVVSAVAVCAAGARSTSGAFGGFEVAANPADLAVDVDSGEDFLSMPLPGVDARGVVTAVSTPFMVAGDTVVTPPRSSTVIAASGVYLEGVSQVRVLEGRLPRPGADEGLATDLWLAQTGLHVGDTAVFRMVDQETFDRFWRPGPGGEQALREALIEDPTLGWQQPIAVVGRGVAVEDVARDQALRPSRLIIDRETATHLSRERFEDVFSYGSQAMMTLEPGADPAAVIERLQPESIGRLAARDLATVEREVERATQPFVSTLWIAAALAAVVGGMVVGAAMARQAVADSQAHSRLWALGMDRAALRMLVVARALVITSVMVVTATMAMIGMSVAFPVGPMGGLEARSIEIDVPVLVLVALVTVMGGCLVSVVAVRVTNRRLRGAVHARPSTALRSPLPLSARLGLHFAAAPGPGLGFVTRSAVVAAAIAVATATAVATLGASLDDLLDHPGRHGWNWDVAGTCQEGYCDIDAQAADHINTTLAAEPEITSWTLVTFETLRLEGDLVPVIAVEQLSGPLEPFTITEGRAPQASDEVALGAATMRALDQRVGDYVTVANSGHRFRVVGTAVFTGLGRVDSLRPSLGNGAALTSEGLHRLVGDEVDPDALLANVKPGGGARLRALLPGFVLIDSRLPGALAAWPPLRNLSLIAAGLLTALAFGSVLHARVLFRQRRARDLSALEALGMDPRQLTNVLRWHSLALFVAALVVGLPMGVLIGARIWQHLTDRLDLVSPRRVLSLHLAIVIAIVLLLTVTIGATTHRWRAHAAQTSLRAE